MDDTWTNICSSSDTNVALLPYLIYIGFGVPPGKHTKVNQAKYVSVLYICKVMNLWQIKNKDTKINLFSKNKTLSTYYTISDVRDLMGYDHAAMCQYMPII